MNRRHSPLELERADTVRTHLLAAGGRASIDQLERSLGWSTQEVCAALFTLRATTDDIALFTHRGWPTEVRLVEGARS